MELSVSLLLLSNVTLFAIYFGNGCREHFQHEQYLTENAAGARAMLAIGERWYIGEWCGWDGTLPEPARVVNLEDETERENLLNAHRDLIPGGLLDVDGDAIPDVLENFTRLRVRRTAADPVPRLQLVLRYDRERHPNMDLDNLGSRIGLQGVTQPDPVTIRSCRELYGPLEDCARRIGIQSPELVWEKQLLNLGAQKQKRRFFKELNHDDEHC